MIGRIASQHRRGTSILEVMFAILVTTIGLLGAVAVFPVASTVARNGRVADQTAASGRAAVSVFDSMGMRRPDMWLAWDPVSTQFQPLSPPVYGESMCIDPRCVALNGGGGPTQWFPVLPTSMSNAAQLATPVMRRITLRNQVGGGAMGQLQANDVFVLDDDLKYFRPGLDDTEVAGIPHDRSLPAFAEFEQFPGNVGKMPFSRRKLDAHFSWFATLVPKMQLYYLPVPLTAPQPVNDEYVLSIVIFNDRLADLNSQIVGERIVDVAFQPQPPPAGVVPNGATGGEVLLHWNSPPNNDDAAAEALKLHANDWILLSGCARHPATGAFSPRFIPGNQNTPPVYPTTQFQWYRVTHCDKEPAYNASPGPAFSSGGYQLYASLTGQDWNVSLINPRSPGAMALPPTVNGTACATLLTGVVGVYEKTVRLEYGDSL